MSAQLQTKDIHILQGSPRYRFFLRYQIGRYCEMTVLFKRLTVFRFLTVPLLAVHGIAEFNGTFSAVSKSDGIF